MRARGYTLLEVLVATAIFSFSAVAVLSALSMSTRNAARITDRDRAMLLARQKMDELLLAHDLPKGVPVEGVCDPALNEAVPCGWRAQMTTFEVAMKGAGNPELDRIQVEVWWGAEADRHSFHLSGYRRGALSVAEAAALAEQDRRQ